MSCLLACSVLSLFFQLIFIYLFYLHTFVFLSLTRSLSSESHLCCRLFICKPKKMTWTKAQKYCRAHYTDLASGLDQADGEEFKTLKQPKDSPMNVWIGLFRDTWRWSDGSNFSFRHWNMESFYDGQNNRKCAVTLLNTSGKWSSDECNKKNPFFCYDGEFLLRLI
uniref:C-type lectin domain-containing protein n=1 Tax=Oreochromis niloticus TaxID=8128 RepID=I3IZM8_ORENI